MATEGRQSPSVARSLSDLEAADVIAIAQALPDGWCVTIEPPHGQLSIHPLIGRRRYYNCHIAARALGRITRDR